MRLNSYSKNDIDSFFCANYRWLKETATNLTQKVYWKGLNECNNDIVHDLYESLVTNIEVINARYVNLSAYSISWLNNQIKLHETPVENNYRRTFKLPIGYEIEPPFCEPEPIEKKKKYTPEEERIVNKYCELTLKKIKDLKKIVSGFNYLDRKLFDIIYVQKMTNKQAAVYLNEDRSRVGQMVNELNTKIKWKLRRQGYKRLVKMKYKKRKKQSNGN